MPDWVLGKKMARARRYAFCPSMNKAKRRGVVIDGTALETKIIPASRLS